MSDYCEICGSDPCVCNDGFSIKEGDDLIDEVLDDDILLADSTPDDIDIFSAGNEEQDSELLFDEDDDSIDLPYTDEENMI